MIPVILSGGSGTRLWPLSRKMYPKQFLSLLHDETMLQKTLLRLADLEHAPPIVVCNDEHRFPGGACGAWAPRASSNSSIKDRICRSALRASLCFL